MKALRLSDVSYSKLFPSGYWEASIIHNNFLYRARSDTKKGAREVLREMIRKDQNK